MMNAPNATNAPTATSETSETIATSVSAAMTVTSETIATNAMTSMTAPRRALALGFFPVVTLLPLSAFADTAASAAAVMSVSLDSGIVGAWVGTSKGVAFSLLPFFFIVALILEAFGKAPGEPRDFGSVVFRSALVLVLLTFYGKLFGALMGFSSGLAARIAPKETWEKLKAATQVFLDDKARYQAQELLAAKSGSLTDGVMAYVAGKADAVGGALIDAAVSLILLLGEASLWIVGTFGQVLGLLLFVLGPLAIAVSLPRSSDVGTRWFRVFASVLTWPLISALLVGLITEFALKALKPQSSYESAYKCIALAGMLCVTAFAVPVIASALTGAGLGALGAGWSSLSAMGSAATGGVSSGLAAVSNLSNFGGHDRPQRSTSPGQSVAPSDSDVSSAPKEQAS
jgi:hypothetical protein